MKETRVLMGMPITVEIVDLGAKMRHIDKVFEYFTYIDEKFSTYKESSEISQFNRKEIQEKNFSDDMKIVFRLAEKTRLDSHGYFNIKNGNVYDPSGIVKGWAILEAVKILKNSGLRNFYIEAGGDTQVSGLNKDGKKWQVGIRNPFNRKENVKVIVVTDKGIATSGTYIRGQHIYDPFNNTKTITDVVSLTVVGDTIYEADRFATAAFAMRKKGINFIEEIPGLEGYMVDDKGVATYTSGFTNYTVENA